MVALGIVFASGYKGNEVASSSRLTHDLIEFSSPAAISDLESLLKLDPVQLRNVDIAKMNLLCALGLPGSEDLDVDREMKKLDQWADLVRKRTLENVEKFKRSPHRFHNSEAFFKMSVLISLLQGELGVHYDTQQEALCKIALESKNRGEKIFIPDDVFRNSKLMFINGILSEYRGGTCASLPVAYIAVGRRLGYPLKLVAANNHFYVRWEDEKDRINFEGSGKGFNSYPDEYYKSWPHELSEDDIKAGHFLKSLSPSEELAIFLLFRTECLRTIGQKDSGHRTINHAQKLWPEQPMVLRGKHRLRHHGVSTSKEKETELSDLNAELIILRTLPLDQEKRELFQRAYYRLVDATPWGPEQRRELEYFRCKVMVEEARVQLKSYMERDINQYEQRVMRPVSGPFIDRSRDQKRLITQFKRTREMAFQNEMLLQEENALLISGWEPGNPLPWLVPEEVRKLPRFKYAGIYGSQ
jgi:hypothetical protein